MSLKQATLAQVHAEFEQPYTEEQLKLMEDVENILKEDTKDLMIDMQQLESLGFTQSKTFIDYKRKRELSKLVKLRDYYLENYGYDFVTEKKITEICKFYGLVRADVEYFIGEIPPENIKEITQFTKVKPEDRRYAYTAWGREGRKETTYKQFLRQREKIKKENSPFFTPSIGHNTKIEIVGTEDQFNTRGLTLNDESQKFEVLPEDPIVLYPVRQGFLVLSKWGVEADINLHK